MDSSAPNDLPEVNIKPGLPPIQTTSGLFPGPPPVHAPSGLPPVQPPSGRFIVQLFVIPASIIFVLLLVYLGANLKMQREHEPAYFLQQLDSDNPDIRWRGASDLAQILLRPEPATLRWKADAKFALDLTERLESAYTDLLKEEKKIAATLTPASTALEQQLAWRKLRNHRDTISFLAAALGEFYAPVGVPVLCAILKQDASPDLKGNTMQRRKALWALMKMGENLGNFATIPLEQRRQLIESLQEEASRGTPNRAAWARTALYYADSTALPIANRQDVVRVDETLVFCADADDRFLRELTAMAFNFWDGPQAEATLLKLANDAGRGTLLSVDEND
jgi:hypothetical protein